MTAYRLIQISGFIINVQHIKEWIKEIKLYQFKTNLINEFMFRGFGLRWGNYASKFKSIFPTSLIRDFSIVIFSDLIFRTHTDRQFIYIY